MVDVFVGYVMFVRWSEVTKLAPIAVVMPVAAWPFLMRLQGI